MKNNSEKSVTIFTKPTCPHCRNAKSLLKSKNFSFEEIILDENVTMKSVFSITGRKTVPQIFIDSDHIGGNDDLEIFLGT
jgi:glutaredoxin-like protein